MTLPERALIAYACFCLRLFVLAGEAFGGAVLYLAGLMPGHNDEQRVTSLVIVVYATVALLSVATMGAALILSLLEITP